MTTWVCTRTAATWMGWLGGTKKPPGANGLRDSMYVRYAFLKLLDLRWWMMVGRVTLVQCIILRFVFALHLIRLSCNDDSARLACKSMRRNMYIHT